MKMNLDYQTCKSLIDRLKTNQKFKIVEEDKPHGFGDGVDYWEFTILESDNLNVIYAQDYLVGFSSENDISIIDTKNNVCVYSNAPGPESFWGSDGVEKGIDKLERMNINTLDELTKYLAERLQVPISTLKL